MIYPDGSVRITPDLSYRKMTTHPEYINSCTALNLNGSDLAKLLERMTLQASVSSFNPEEVEVRIPATRPDIMHECDLVEDAAIAYGFNNLPDAFPPTSTVGQPLAVSKLTDIVRKEWAQAGWVEVFPFSLVSFSQHSSYRWKNNSLMTFKLVFTRRKLRLAQPQRRQYSSGQDSQSQNSRIPSGQNIPTSRSPQNDTRESFPCLTHQDLRRQRRRL